MHHHQQGVRQAIALLCSCVRDCEVQRGGTAAVARSRGGARLQQHHCQLALCPQNRLRPYQLIGVSLKRRNSLLTKWRRRRLSPAAPLPACDEPPKLPAKVVQETIGVLIIGRVSWGHAAVAARSSSSTSEACASPQAPPAATFLQLVTDIDQDPQSSSTSVRLRWPPAPPATPGNLSRVKVHWHWRPA